MSAISFTVLNQCSLTVTGSSVRQLSPNLKESEYAQISQILLDDQCLKSAVYCAIRLGTGCHSLLDTSQKV
eukprot:313281-Amphidinium_carterae.1